MTSQAQRSEIAKYARTYRNPAYRMGSSRFTMATRALEGCLGDGDSYLDVGCGRGEMLDVARDLGVARLMGIEVVPQLFAHDQVVYGLAWDLPFTAGCFDVVSLFDVIEHLRPEDTEPTLAELGRVSKRTILITANNRDSYHEGVQLHVNKRDYDDWDELFTETFPGCVTWLHDHVAGYSEMWRIDL